MATERLCTNCLFGEKMEGAEVVTSSRSRAWGECRKEAPAVLAVRVEGRGDMMRTVFPVVTEDQWCGEYTARTKADDYYGKVEVT